jgi:hypothetical protein
MVIVLGVACTLAAFTARVSHAQATGSPCGLLTQAEIKAALGAPVGPGSPISTTGCEWVTTGSSPSPAEHVTIATQSADSYDRMKAMQLPHVVKSGVTGIGDDAFYATVSTFTSLSVKKGSTVFIIHLYGVPGQAQQMTVEKALALDAAPRV